MIRDELTKSVPAEYNIISVRINKNEPTVYVLAEKNGQRVGLLSKDGGKTYEEVWKKGDK